MQLTDYHAKYYAHELTKRCSSDSLEKLTASLADAQVDLNPHQVDAALFAFRSPLSRGAILADEVGLGKTIEAGIVLSQIWAERKRKILIIVPSSLRKQWNQELLEKFFLPSTILESKSFNQYFKNVGAHCNAPAVNPFEQSEIIITSYQFARNKCDQVRDVKWDLVVIDEAHRLRNVYKTSNKIARALKEALAHAPKLLLTATPLQNSLMELYGLVGFIDDYIFGDIKSYKNQFARLTNEINFDELKARIAPICKRTLRRQVLEYIKYTNRIPITQEFVPTKDEAVLYDLVSEYLRRVNLQALPASQRSLMTLVLRKLLASSTFAIAGALDSIILRLKAKLKNASTTLSSSNASAMSSPNAPIGDPDLKNGFPITPPDGISRGQALGMTDIFVDELADDFETLDEIKDEWEEYEYEERLTREDRDTIQLEIIDLEAFRDLAVSITENAKGTSLIQALKAGFAKAEELGASKKAIIFTESRRTQNYLVRILSETEYQGKIVLFNGSNSDEQSKQIYQKWYQQHQGSDRASGSRTADMRSALVDYFKEEAQIMIATEAAAEGINLQFCSLVVNYDLPWNPQRIEQRIGRCHRYGQKHDVVVVNFLNRNNAADQRVYELLAEKFALFDGVFGASDEVLGSIESGVDFEKHIVRIYQECRSPEEIQASFDELQRELETEIDESMKLTRKKLLENFDEDVHEKLRVNLKESTEYLNRYENWLWELAKYTLHRHADFHDGEMAFVLNEHPFHILSSPNASIGDPDSNTLKKNGFPIRPSGMTTKVLSSPNASIGDPDSNMLKKNGFPITPSGMTTKVLSSPNASIGDPDSNMLKKNGFPITPSGMTSNLNIPLGLYRMGRHVEDSHIFRIGHPLAQHILDNAGNKKLPHAEIAFDYSSHQSKISILEPLVGSSGYLSLAKLSVESFEEEDHLIFSAVTDGGTILDEEQAQRLFSLPGTCKGAQQCAPTVRDQLQQIFESGKFRIIEAISARNSVFLDDEMDKLEKWADDLKSGLEYELKELDREIKFLKTESKKILKLDEKLKAQKDIKEMEKKRNTKRRTLFEAQDEIDSRKEGLIEGVEARLQQLISTSELFAIRWRVV